MKGLVTIDFSTKVEGNSINYHLEFNRNISIIMGDSTTGKTSFIRLLRNHFSMSLNSSLKSEGVESILLATNENDLSLYMEYRKNCIIFIDEELSNYVASVDFAHMLKHNNNNYIVILNRDSIKTLAYSVDSIYLLKTEYKTVYNKKMYNVVNKPYIYYSNTNNKLMPDYILCEDEGSGKTFYESHYPHLTVNSCNGNGNVKNKIMEFKKDCKLLCICDGAAFEPYIVELMRLCLMYRNLTIYLPESFEWLLLNSSLFKQDVALQDILKRPEDYIDTSIYLTWERYFTALLISKCLTLGIAYNKSSTLPNGLNSTAIHNSLNHLLPKVYNEDCGETDLFN